MITAARHIVGVPEPSTFNAVCARRRGACGVQVDHPLPDKTGEAASSSGRAIRMANHTLLLPTHGGRRVALTAAWRKREKQHQDPKRRHDAGRRGSAESGEASGRWTASAAKRDATSPLQ